MKLTSILVTAGCLITSVFTPLAAEPAANVEIIWSTNAHAYGVRAVAFSGDSQLLASGSGDQTALVWRVTNSAPVRSLGNSEGVTAVAISSNGTYAAVGGGRW